MTSRSTRNLQYVNEKQTQSWIAQQSGIPRSTVGFVLRGERALPSKYNLQARAIYQTQVYSRLKAEGMSANQATRFKWYAPEAVGLKTAIMKEIVKESTALQIAINQKRDEKQGIIKSADEYRKDTIEQVKAAYRRSKNPLEEWLNYYAWAFLKV